MFFVCFFLSIISFDTKRVVLLIVAFLDCPSKPEGPLDALDVTPDSCVLKWKPPLVSKSSICFIYTYAIAMLH